MPDSSTVQTLLVWGGIPALTLMLFFTVMWKFKFNFGTIDPRFSGWIAVLLLVFVTIITVIALFRFSEPARVAVVSHEGPLAGLINQLARDSSSGFVINLDGRAEQRELLSQLYIHPTSAGNYPDLLGKICQANARCIKCDAAAVDAVNISLTGHISKSCKIDGESVYCCS